MSSRRLPSATSHPKQLVKPGPWLIDWRDGNTTHRIEIRGVLTIGRDDTASIRVSDPYVSRRHCTVSVVNGRPLVDAGGSLNRVRVRGSDFSQVALDEGDVFVLGKTSFRVHRGGDERTTILLRDTSPRLLLRQSTRELFDHESTLIAKFSLSEYAAFECTASSFPNAASYDDIAQAVWQGLGYDPYQIHRLMQRIRQRLGNTSHVLANVRGTGYRLTEPIGRL